MIREAAASPPLVVVGHGTQALFQDRPGTLHLRLVAPLRARVRRLRARAGCTGEDAVALARRMDEERTLYVRRYHRGELHDPLLYDLLLNTGALSLGEPARIVLAMAEGRRGRGDGEAVMVGDDAS